MLWLVRLFCGHRRLCEQNGRLDPVLFVVARCKRPLPECVRDLTKRLSLSAQRILTFRFSNAFLFGGISFFLDRSVSSVNRGVPSNNGIES